MATIRSRNYLLRPGMDPSEAVAVNDRVAAMFRLPSGSENWESIDDLVDVDWTETTAVAVSTESPRELPGWVTPVEAALGIPGLFQAIPEERVEVGLLVLVRCELPPLEEGGEEPGQARLQWLIWSFGSGFANFVRDKFVPDYGVRSVLNAAARIAEDNGIAPSLKAVQFVIGGATRQRAAHTAMESLRPDEFRMNTIADLLAGAGVSSHPLAGSVEGTVGLVGSFDLTAMDQIQDLSTQLVRQYEDDIYEQAFSFYAHRRPVMDIFLEADLYEDLYNALVAEDVRVSCPIVVGPNKGDGFDPLASSLRSHLMRELMVGRAICDALLQCRSSPLRNKQRRQRLASPRGEFEGNIRAVGVVGRVTTQ